MSYGSTYDRLLVMIEVASQGQAGSFHGMAAQKFFAGKDIRIVPCDTFRQTFATLRKGADYAVAALENSLYGSINDVYDLLLSSRYWISGEVYLRVEHCLLGLPGADVNKISEVHSQAPALGQCQEWLELNLPKAKHVEEHDTAASAQLIKKLGNPHKAAIASEQAGILAGLEVLAKGIETHPENFTRFAIVCRDRVDNNQANKTSFTLVTAHHPGALYHALGVFNTENINLTKLQSRPVIGEKWHYMFYIDADAGLQEPGMQRALKGLVDQDCQVTILGSYYSDGGR